MKKTILTLVASAFMICAILTSCSSPADQVENAEDNVAEANKQLDEANQAYLADIESYREVISLRIEENNKTIAELKEKAKLDKKSATPAYKEKIAELEQKNADMKKRMDEYKPEGKDKWEAFKAEFSSDMERLGNAFKDLAVKNNK